MSDYDLTDEAAEDIREIIRYTLRQWGRPQVARYRQALNHCLDGLASGDVHGKVLLPTLPDVRGFRCWHHFIFYLESNNPRPLVIAVLHERRDLVAGLMERFPTDGPS